MLFHTYLVEFFRPFGRKALHFRVLKVGLAVLVRVDGHLCDVGDARVARPVIAADVLQMVSLAQPAARKRLCLQLDLDAGRLPHARFHVERVLDGVLHGQLTKVWRGPGNDRYRITLAFISLSCTFWGGHVAVVVVVVGRAACPCPGYFIHELAFALFELGLRDKALHGET